MWLREALWQSIYFYQISLSPYMGRRCRFVPTCSEYAKGSILCRGALRGIAMAARRLLRCHPLCEGGFDPVPK